MNLLKAPFLVPVKEYCDEKGALRVTQEGDLPFSLKRVFWITQVPEDTLRGGHAHHSSQQVLICTQGQIEVNLEDLQGQRYQYHLEPGQPGLFIPALCWGEFIFKSEAQALCLASDEFDESDYIRDYRQFKELKHAREHH